MWLVMQWMLATCACCITCHPLASLPVSLHRQVFIQVDMLYVNLEINRHTVKAFVDSGAQMTIVSQVSTLYLYCMGYMHTRGALPCHNAGISL